MKLFITGASGFVGGAAAKYFASQSHEVIAMSRSEKSDAKIKANGAIPVRCELGNVPATVLEGCDVIIHAAAYVEDWGTKEDFYKANVDGTHQLLQAAKEAYVKNFIHIGTEAALWYGQDIVNADEEYPLVTKSPFLYSETKSWAEKLVRMSNHDVRFRTVVVRPRMIWGPGDQTILPKAVEMYKQKKFQWVDNGKYETSTTHIDNLMEGIRLAIEKGKGGEAYFITDDETSTFKSFFTGLFASQGIEVKAGNVPKTVIRGVASVLNFWYKLLNIKSAPMVTKHPAALMSSHCTLKNDKAKRELGYQPVISVAEGMNGLKQL
jgi:nucleoside-diphosphate-sugar epimerase